MAQPVLRGDARISDGHPTVNSGLSVSYLPGLCPRVMDRVLKTVFEVINLNGAEKASCVDFLCGEKAVPSSLRP